MTARMEPSTNDAAAGPPSKASSLLVLGGARSGKSGFAQAQVEASGLERVFVATAQAYDDEMTARIALHVAARDRDWTTIDSPYDLVDRLRVAARPGRAILVDCLTLWLSNIMLRGDDVEASCRALSELVPCLAGAVVFVSNEVGGGIVPENALARRFRDAQGRLNQSMAATCGTVVLVQAGLPLLLKPQPVPTIRF
jgi:adenosylcobinamide kinase/adenosylcobinamide-phosphate guanylyltransferase